MGEKIIYLHEDEQYITLQSLLQVGGVISTGGMAKIFLAKNDVMVNGEREDRRGRKLYSGDKVQVDNLKFVVR